MVVVHGGEHCNEGGGCVGGYNVVTVQRCVGTGCGGVYVDVYHTAGIDASGCLYVGVDGVVGGSVCVCVGESCDNVADGICDMLM